MVDLHRWRPFYAVVTEETKKANFIGVFFLSFGYIGLQFLLTPLRIKTVTSILAPEQYADLNMVMMNISFIGVMLSLGSYEYLLRTLPGKTQDQQLSIIRVFIQFFWRDQFAGGHCRRGDS